MANKKQANQQIKDSKEQGTSKKDSELSQDELNKVAGGVGSYVPGPTVYSARAGSKPSAPPPQPNPYSDYE